MPLNTRTTTITKSAVIQKEGASQPFVLNELIFKENHGTFKVLYSYEKIDSGQPMKFFEEFGKKCNIDNTYPAVRYDDYIVVRCQSREDAIKVSKIAHAVCLKDKDIVIQIPKDRFFYQV